MEVIEINEYMPQRRQLATNKKRKADAARLLNAANAAVRVGLFTGTAALVCKAVVWAAEVAQGRLSIPGGEVFTIPFIVALFAVGYVLRGDVEAIRRRRRREQRRRAHEQRSK